MAEEENIKTLVHLHLAGWRELQAVFQDAEKHWKQLEEQQVATCQMVRSGNRRCAWGQELPSHHPSSLQTQLQGELEPFFLLKLVHGGHAWKDLVAANEINPL
ncbi:hypothetical protein AOLI_G00229840 [Acnodon oligacanthus]